MFIQTEPTPNPATLKFIPGRTVLPEGALEFRSLESAAGSPLATALLSLPGVAAVMFGGDFISVTKGDADWTHVKPMALGVIMEHFTAQAPLFLEGGAPAPRPRHTFTPPRPGASMQRRPAGQSVVLPHMSAQMPGPLEPASVRQ